MDTLRWTAAPAQAAAQTEADESRLLPRTFLHFDDVVGDDRELHSPFAGQLASKVSDSPVAERYQGGGFTTMGYSRAEPSRPMLFKERT